MNYNNDLGLIDTILTLDTTEAPPLGGQTNVLVVLGNGAITLPGGSTAQQPSPAAAGMLRYNDGGYLEFYDGVTSSWQTLSYASGSVSSFTFNETSDTAIFSTTPTTAATGAITATMSLLSQSANKIFAGPSTGASAQPTFRTLVAGDIPAVTNIAGGTTGSIVYQTGPSTTGFISPGTTGYVLTSNGPGNAPTYTAVVNSFSAGSTGFTPTTATTGAVTLSGVLSLANGGTNSANTGSNGSILYNNGSAIVNSTVGTNNSALLSSGAGAPTWLTVSSTVTTNQILQGDGAGAFIANGGSFVGSGTYSGVTLQGTVTNPTDAVTKAYADSLLNGLSWKNAVRASTIVAGTLASSFAAGQVIDGYTLVLGDRILIKNQAASTENGIYIVTAGTPTRSTDANTTAELNGAAVYVEAGTTNKNTAWTQTTVDPTVGSTAIVWSQFSGQGTYTAGSGLTLTGNVFSANTDGSTTYVNGSNQISVLSSSTLDQVLLSQGVGNTALWGAVQLGNTNSVNGTLAVSNGGTGATTFTSDGVLYGNGSGAIQSTAAGTNGQVLTVVGGVPAWSNTADTSLTSTYIGYGSSTNTLTGSGDFTWDESTATLAISGSANATTFQPNMNDIILGDPSFTITNNFGITLTSNSSGVVINSGNVYFGLPNAQQYGTLSYSAGGISLNSAASLYFNIPTNEAIYINGSAGTAGQILTSQGITAPPIWTTISTEAVTTLSTGTTGLLANGVNTPVNGAVTLSGTLNVANGGTGDTTLTSNGVLFGNGTSPVGVTSAGSQYNVLVVNASGIPTLGTIDLSQPTAVGTSILRPSNGGTGVANANTSTITLGGSFTTTPANNVTLTTTGPTNVTLPTSGTLLTAGTAVTSFDLTDTSTTPIYTTSPTTSSVGAIASTITLNTQGANLVFAGPTTGAVTQPTFRALVYKDIVGTGAALQLYAESPSSPIVAVATGADTIALGSGSLASQYGSLVHASGNFATAGDAQAGQYILRNITTSASSAELFLDGASTEFILPVNSVVTFSMLISARRTDTTGFGAGFKVEGVAHRDTTAASAALIGATSTTILGRTIPGLTVSVTANTTTGALRISVTGVAASTYRWVAVVNTSEVTN